MERQRVEINGRRESGKFNERRDISKIPIYKKKKEHHKAVELERSPTSSSGSSSGNSSTNSSTNKSPTATTPPPTTTANPFFTRASLNTSTSNSTSSKDCCEENFKAEDDAVGDDKRPSSSRRAEGLSDPSIELIPNTSHKKEYTSADIQLNEQPLNKHGHCLDQRPVLKKQTEELKARNEGIQSFYRLPSMHAIQKPNTSVTKATITPKTNKCAHSSHVTGIAFPTPVLTKFPFAITPSSSPSLPHPSVPPPSHRHFSKARYKRSTILPKTKSLDLAHNSRDSRDEAPDQSDDENDDRDAADNFAGIYRQTTVIQRPQNRFVTNTQSQDEATPTLAAAVKPIPKKGAIPKMQSADSRPNSPRTPLSPGGSPLGSPRSNRRRTPLKESRRISIEQTGDAVQVNQYKLMQEIGQGAYGLVKLAYNEADSTHYAMKMLSKSRLIKKAGLIGRGPKKTQGLTPLQRVYKEIAVLKKLNHPNVVKLVEVLDDPAEDCLYLAFELEQQGEILRIPTDRPLSEERAWSVFRDSLQGLEYLHYQRIIHSDIKPGNLLLGEDGHVKIADLGVCTEFLDDDATMDNKSPAGTPAFRAPETLLEGQHSYSGKAADIWSLGATLYALVYGNVPFVGLTVPAVYEKIKNDSLKFPSFPAISDDLRDLISKILVKNPAQRITLPQIKLHKWVTADGKYPLPTEEENCRLVELESEDLNSVCRSIPKLFDTFVLIKAMLKNHSFQNPFSRSPSGRAPQRGGSRLERFVTAGRSKSAPGDYDVESRHLGSESILPVVTESVSGSGGESLEQSTDEPI